MKRGRGEEGSYCNKFRWKVSLNSGTGDLGADGGRLRHRHPGETRNREQACRRKVFKVNWGVLTVLNGGPLGKTQGRQLDGLGVVVWWRSPNQSLAETPSLKVPRNPRGRGRRAPGDRKVQSKVHRGNIPWPKEDTAGTLRLLNLSQLAGYSKTDVTSQKMLPNSRSRGSALCFSLSGGGEGGDWGTRRGKGKSRLVLIQKDFCPCFKERASLPNEQRQHQRRLLVPMSDTDRGILDEGTQDWASFVSYMWSKMFHNNELILSPKPGSRYSGLKHGLVWNPRTRPKHTVWWKVKSSYHVKWT